MKYVHEFISGDDATSRADQDLENIEFDGCQVDFVSIATDSARSGVEPNTIHFHNLIGADRRTARAAQDGADPGQEFVRTEGLRQIVIGPRIQTGDAVVLLGPRGQHNDGGLGAAAEVAQHLEAIKPGHHDIEKKQVELAFKSSRQASGPVVDRFQPEAALSEKLLHERREFRIVVNQENRKIRHLKITILWQAIPNGRCLTKFLHSAWTGESIVCNFPQVFFVLAEMKLWGALVALYVGAASVAAGPTLDPVPVCEVVSSPKEFEGKPVALVGRYSYRQKARWLDEEGCGEKAHGIIWLTIDPQKAPKPAEQIAIDQPVLEKKLAVIKEHTSLGKFRFGSADYDRWAVVFGRLETREDHELELFYRGDGAVFFLVDK